MEEYYPSEIARLVLGYLKDVKCMNSWQTFLIESSDLQEHYRLYKEGKVYSTNVDGKSLLEILREYCSFIRGSSKQSDTRCDCNKTSNPLNLESHKTPSKNNQNKFTKFRINQKVQTQSVVASLRYGQTNIRTPHRLFNSSESPHHVNVCKTPKRQVGVHGTALYFGPEAHTVKTNGAGNRKSSIEKANSSLQSDNLQTNSIPIISLSCFSEPGSQICHRTVQTDPLSSSVVNLNVDNQSFQTEQSSASANIEPSNLKNADDRLPAQSNIESANSNTTCNVNESSPIYSASESRKALVISSSEPSGPFSSEQLNLESLESSTKIVSTDSQVSIVNQSLVCASSEVTTCSENVVVTATMENSVTPDCFTDPPLYQRAPSTNSPRIILSHDRSLISSLTTPMKDKKYLEEFCSPRRKGLPRRRLLNESPLPKHVQGNDCPSIWTTHEEMALPDFFSYPSLAQKIADNINKVKSSEEVAKDYDGSNSLTYPALQDENNSEDIIKSVLAMTETDHILDEFFLHFHNSRDGYEMNLTQESASNSAQNNSFKGDSDVTKGDSDAPTSTGNKESETLTAVNPCASQNTYMSSITNNESDKLSETSCYVQKNVLLENDSFTNHDTSIQNIDAINCNENTNNLPNNLADTVANSVHNNFEDDDDNDSVVEIAIISPRKHEDSKSIDAPVEISSAPCPLTKNMNAQIGDLKNQSVDITDSCNNTLNQQKSQSLCPQCHSKELITNTVTVGAVNNESLQVVQNTCPNCHSQQLEKNIGENNSSAQMYFMSNEHIINTEDRGQTTVPDSSNDIQFYGNCTGEGKFPVDSTLNKKMETSKNMNQVFASSGASSVVENVVSSQGFVYNKAAHKVTNVRNKSNTITEINTIIPSAQTINIGSRCQSVNNPLPAPTLLQWPYSTVPTILIPNITPNAFPVQSRYQIILNTGLNRSSCNASDIILPVQTVSSVAKIIPNSNLQFPKDTSSTKVATSPANRSEPECEIVEELVSMPPSTKSSENSKRKKEVEDESECPRKRASHDNNSFQHVKQKKKYTKKKKLRSLFPSDSSVSPKDRTPKSMSRKTSEEIPVLSIPEPSPSKTDLRSAFEIFSEITEVTEMQSPVLKSLLSSAKRLSGEGGRLNGTHVRTLDFSPKKDKEKRCSQVKSHWQQKFNEDFPNRRASSRIKKLQNVSVESQNVDFAVDNNTTCREGTAPEERNTKQDTSNNCSASDQHVTSEMINMTIKDVCANKPIASEMADVVLKAMEEAIQLKSSISTDNVLPSTSETSFVTDVSTKIQSDSSYVSMPEVFIDAEDGICHAKLPCVLNDMSKSPVDLNNEDTTKNLSSKSISSLEFELNTGKSRKSVDINPISGNLLETVHENTTVLSNGSPKEQFLHRHEYFPESDNGSSSSSDLPDLSEIFNFKPNQANSQTKLHVVESIPISDPTDELIVASKGKHVASNLQNIGKCLSTLETYETIGKETKTNALIFLNEKSNNSGKVDKLSKTRTLSHVLTDEERLLNYSKQGNKYCKNRSKFSNNLNKKRVINQNWKKQAEKLEEVVEQTSASKSIISATTKHGSLKSMKKKHKSNISTNKKSVDINNKISNELSHQESDGTIPCSVTNVIPNDICLNDKTNLSLIKGRKKTSDVTSSKCLKKLRKDRTTSGVCNKYNDKLNHNEKQVSSLSLHGKTSFEVVDLNASTCDKGKIVNISSSKPANNSPEISNSNKVHKNLIPDTVTFQPTSEYILHHNKSMDCPKRSDMEIIPEHHEKEEKKDLSQSLTEDESQKSRKLNVKTNNQEAIGSKHFNAKIDNTAAELLLNQVSPNPKISETSVLSNSNCNQFVSKNSNDFIKSSTSVSTKQNPSKHVDSGLIVVSKASENLDITNNLIPVLQDNKIDQNSEITNSQAQSSKISHIKSPKDLNLENTNTSIESNEISAPQKSIVPPFKKRIKPVQISSPSYHSYLPLSPFMSKEHVVCINPSSNSSLRNDTCSNAGMNTCDAINVHTSNESVISKEKSIISPKEKTSFLKPLSGKPKAMTEFYKNAVPERSTSIPISPESMSSSSCTLDSFIAKRQLDLATSFPTSVNVNASQAKEIENILITENSKEKRNLNDSIYTDSTFGSLSEAFMSPEKIDADTLSSPPRRRKRKFPVRMFSSPEPTPENSPFKPENQEAEHLKVDSSVNIKSLHDSPVKCTSVVRNSITKSIFHKKIEQNPNMPAGVKMPHKWNNSKISSYTDDIFNNHPTGLEKKNDKKESIKTGKTERRSRPSLKIKSPYKAKNAKQKSASAKNFRKAEIYDKKVIFDKISEKSVLQSECKKRRISHLNSSSSSKSKISDNVSKAKSTKSNSPVHNVSPKKDKKVNNVQEGKLIATKISKISDVYEYKETGVSLQNSNSNTYGRKECISASKNICPKETDKHVTDAEEQNLKISNLPPSKNVKESSTTFEVTTERSYEEENELAQAIAFITTTISDSESKLTDNADKDLIVESKIETEIQEPSSTSPLKQKAFPDDVSNSGKKAEVEKMQNTDSDMPESVENVETEEIATCSHASESVNNTGTEEIIKPGAEVGIEHQAKVDIEHQEKVDIDYQAKVDFLMEKIQQLGMEKILSILRGDS